MAALTLPRSSIVIAGGRTGGDVARSITTRARYVDNQYKLQWVLGKDCVCALPGSLYGLASGFSAVHT